MAIVVSRDCGISMLYVWQITEPLEVLESMAGELCAHPKYLSITSQSRKQEWLASKLIFKTVANGSKISYNKIGAPVTDCGYISISHTNNYVVLLHSHKFACGVDIEYKSRNFCRVATRFLSATEYQECTQTAQLEGVDINSLFGRAWCAKEAIYKIAGRGDIDFAKDITLRNISAVSATCKAYLLEKSLEVEFIELDDKIVAITHLLE